MTKIYCDIADIKTIKEFSEKKIVRGFTTNPSLMRKAGAKDYKSYSEQILKICDNKPVSLEVILNDFDRFLTSIIFFTISFLNFYRVFI